MRNLHKNAWQEEICERFALLGLPKLLIESARLLLHVEKQTLRNHPAGLCAVQFVAVGGTVKGAAA